MPAVSNARGPGQTTSCDARRPSRRWATSRPRDRASPPVSAGNGRFDPMARDRSEERRILGVFTTDTHLVVRTWDGFLPRLTGISAADALGHPIGRLLPGLDDRGLLARFRDVAANGTVEVLSPALHHGLLVSPPSESATLAHMRQRITIGPVR